MPSGTDDRAYWMKMLAKLATPVLESAGRGQLRGEMPVECKPGQESIRVNFTHLEAVGRLLAGMAPWLESGPDTGDEGELRRRFQNWAVQAITHGVDPSSPDHWNFTMGLQPIVDTAFLSHALIRAPRALWDPLPAQVRANLIAALRSTRQNHPAFNNWLLFAATTEIALRQFGAADWDPMRVDYAIRQHDQWYKGDGAYGDGAAFHWDYYNSFVIQPMLLDVVEAVANQATGHFGWKPFAEPVRKRALRYAAVQERLIAPDGSFPALGRSLAYRCGAFQLLAQMALRRELPLDVTPAQVRCALTAVIRRTLEPSGTFDNRGWLRIGLAGHQPAIGEDYISTGSLYLCSTAFLPLGLPAQDPFWADAPQLWTSQRVWSGENAPADHALHG